MHACTQYLGMTFPDCCDDDDDILLVNSNECRKWSERMQKVYRNFAVKNYRSRGRDDKIQLHSFVARMYVHVS